MKIFIGQNSPDSSFECVGFETNLDSICENNSCSSIHAPNMLDFIPFSDQKNFILHLVKKLRHGGELIIGGTDIISYALHVFNKDINLEQANAILFGYPATLKKGFSCLEEVRKIILSTDLKITRQQIIPEKVAFVIGAKRS